MNNKEPESEEKIPGPKAKKAVEQTHKYIATTTRGERLVVKKQEGSKITDVDGNTYIDFSSGISVANVGHRNPRVVDAVKKQLDKFIHDAPTDFYDDIQWRLAKKLTEITPGAFKKKVYFGNSGTEAVEAAIKAVKKNNKGKRILAFLPSFHGRTIGSLSLTASKPVHRKGYFPMMPGVAHAPYPYCYRCPFNQDPDSCGTWCADYIEEVLFNYYIPPEEVAGVFMEPVSGEGGYVVPPKKFVQKVEKITKKHGIALVSDEIQAGLGRSGRMVTMEEFGVTPDVITFAKALSMGVPLGATVLRQELAFKEKGSHSTTFGGNGLAVAAASTVIDILREKELPKRSRRLGKKVRKRLNDLKEEIGIIGDVRGLGLMIGIEVVKEGSKEYNVKDRDKIVEESFKRGIVMLPCGTSSFRIIPSLTISRDLLNEGLEVVESVIKDVNSGRV